MVENNQPFPEQSEPDKLHGTTNERDQKEKYLRDSGKIEDIPGDSDVAKMNTNKDSMKNNGSLPMTDQSGEEENEDYINTDERKRDIKQQND